MLISTNVNGLFYCNSINNDSHVPFTIENEVGTTDDLAPLLDIDDDSLNNFEEYLVSFWGSDPFRKDLFIEMDIMAEEPLGQNSSVPLHSKELLKTAFNKRNIVLHIDDGCMDGGEIIPFNPKNRF